MRSTKQTDLAIFKKIKYSVRSTNELFDIHSNEIKIDKLASSDAETLFTNNVHINENMGILISYLYNQTTHPPSNIRLLYINVYLERDKYHFMNIMVKFTERLMVYLLAYHLALLYLICMRPM